MQREDQPIILTGYSALNKLLGREVYTSHMQVGGWVGGGGGGGVAGHCWALLGIAGHCWVQCCGQGEGYGD